MLLQRIVQPKQLTFVPASISFAFPLTTLRKFKGCPIPSLYCRTAHTSPLSSNRKGQSAALKTAPHSRESSLAGSVDDSGIRVNKCFKSFASRRESDVFIDEGRVTINGTVARPGDRVRQGDVVELDGRHIDWQRLTVNANTEDFVYIKHWKAFDVICTTDDTIPNNIIESVRSFTNADRVFPVGRLDQASTGIILLTSDGRLPNAVLGAKSTSEKTYLVTSDMYVPDADIQRLRNGIVINSVAQRDNYVRKPRVFHTMPCKIERGEDDLQLIITLREGRNRQIRKMLGALGYTARTIHRTSFMGITLDGLEGPGSSSILTDNEMKLVRNHLSDVVKS